MNETLKIIKNRRSIRNYKAKQISDADLQALLEAALDAPNARNQQKWHFTVIQNKDIVDKMVAAIKEGIMKEGNDFLKERAKTPGYHTFYHAPTVILISADQKAQFTQLDCGAAAQNIIIAAESLSLNSCFVVSAGFAFKSEKGDEFRKQLSIPEGYHHVCSVVVGYKDGADPEIPLRNKGVINYVK
jgi:nitroreductase